MYKTWELHLLILIRHNKTFIIYRIENCEIKINYIDFNILVIVLNFEVCIKPKYYCFLIQSLTF